MIFSAKKAKAIILSFSLLSTISLNAESFFSGLTGVKINFSGNELSESYDPDLKLQAFFAGQFNFMDNLWARTEFSLNTGDFISENIFKETTSLFQIDELSLNLRSNAENYINYLSLFLGTFEPIGSDVFLQRYFKITPIASKLTESWLGLSGSILYPQRGFGLSNTLKFLNIPSALNISAYLNTDEYDYFVFNTDIRFAMNYRYFTADVLCGIGLPLGSPVTTDEYFIAIEKIYWHAGTNILFGNDYTQSLFIQAGIFNASFIGKTTVDWAEKNIYLMFEPRFILKKLKCDISLYNLPESNVKELQNVDCTLGININCYSENVKIGNKTFTIGCHTNAGLKNKTIFNLEEPTNFTENFIFNITGYSSSDLLSGELHVMLKLKIMELTRNNPGNVFSCGIGYRTKI